MLACPTHIRTRYASTEEHDAACTGIETRCKRLGLLIPGQSRRYGSESSHLLPVSWRMVLQFAGKSLGKVRHYVVSDDGTASFDLSSALHVSTEIRKNLFGNPGFP